MAALSDALAVASPDEADEFAAELIDLARLPGKGDRALMELVRRFARLSDQGREAALACRPWPWTEAVARVAREADPPAQLSLAVLARRTLDPSLASLASDLLLSPSSAVAAAAEQSLVALAQSIDPSSPASAEGGAQMVEAAVADAVDRYDSHRRRGALVAALCLLDRPFTPERRAGPLARWLLAEGHPAHLAMRAIIRRSEQAAMRTRAWIWLRSAALGPACLDRLSSARSELEHAVVLARMHLLRHPARRARLRRMEISAGASRPAPIPPPAMALNLPIRARRGLAQWLSVVPLPPAARDAQYASMLADPDVGVRLTIAREAGDLAPAPPCLLDLCFDPDERVARSAALRWAASEGGATAAVGSASASGRAAGRSPYAAMRRSPHASVRAIAEQELAAADPFGASGDPRAMVAVRERLRRERSAVLEQFRGALADTGSRDALAAALAARRLGLAGELANELLTLARSATAPGSTEAAQDRHARCRSAAVSALGEVPTSAVRRGLEGLIADADPRVRANALEALVRWARRAGEPVGRGSAVGDVLERLTDDPHHRVRAAALHALLISSSGRADGPASATDDDAALEGLARLLNDPRPAHRGAGLWLAERAGLRRRSGRWSDLAGRVADLASADPDPGTRARAQRCAQRLLACVRHGWSTRAATLTRPPSTSAAG